MPVRCEFRSLRHSCIVVVVFYDGVEKLFAQYIHKNNSECKGCNCSFKLSHLDEKMIIIITFYVIFLLLHLKSKKNV